MVRAQNDCALVVQAKRDTRDLDLDTINHRLTLTPISQTLFLTLFLYNYFATLS